VRDIRKARKLATFRGTGLGDIIGAKDPFWWKRGDGLALDDFYRRCLSTGLCYHEDSRGYLPAGLVEEIRSLSHPPIAWDAELAEWFDAHFQNQAEARSYARPSRRQSSTPDIPRPGQARNMERPEHTFGVLLDTSGSMDRLLLGKALGAIVSYGVSKDVRGVRVVFCDAAPYDQGFLRPEDIAGTVKILGRGGTVLQPGIDLLNAADDFPKEAPLLVITDGQCDSLSFRGREHAFLIPSGASLPFQPRGDVFRVI
jgi:predicted metal-dependent peptidase